MPYTLTIGSNSVVVDSFREANEPRILANPATSEYTGYGYTVVKGTVVEPKYIWTVQAWMYPADYDLLWVIYSESDRRRRNLIDHAVTIDDTVREVYEPTRTRALATGASEVATGSGYVKYFARFEAMFSAEPQVVQRNFRYGVNFTLTEMDKVPV